MFEHEANHAGLLNDKHTYISTTPQITDTLPILPNCAHCDCAYTLIYHLSHTKHSQYNLR